MTIIFQQGNQFWIESHNVTVILADAAGNDDSNTQIVDRGGHLMGWTITGRFVPNNDNSQATASFAIRDTGGSINIGDEIISFFVRMQKQIGTAGNTNFDLNVMLFMRGSGH